MAEIPAPGRRWLFVTTHFPWPISQGLWLRVYHLTRSLRDLGDHVSILTTGRNREGIEAYANVGVEILDDAPAEYAAEGSGRGLGQFFAHDRLMAEAVARHAPRFDAVVLASATTLPYAEAASRGGCVIADIIDDPARAKLSMLASASGPLDWIMRVLRIVRLPLYRSYERPFLKFVDLSTFVSEQDRASFAKRHRRKRSAVVPNGVDVDHFRPEAGRARAAGAPTITFPGIMRYQPNRDAAKAMIGGVAPHIWAEIPEARFVIAGADPPEEIRALAGPRVEVTGWVDDMRPYLWDSDVVLLPMMSGTGIKNKLLEAWAAEVAVVATPLAGQGVRAVDGENLLFGGSPAELADAVVRLLRDSDLRGRIARAGREVVVREQTWLIMAELFRREVDEATRT